MKKKKKTPYKSQIIFQAQNIISAKQHKKRLGENHITSIKNNFLTMKHKTLDTIL